MCLAWNFEKLVAYFHVFVFIIALFITFTLTLSSTVIWVGPVIVRLFLHLFWRMVFLPRLCLLLMDSMMLLRFLANCVRFVEFFFHTCISLFYVILLTGCRHTLDYFWLLINEPTLDWSPIHVAEPAVGISRLAPIDTPTDSKETWQPHFTVPYHPTARSVLAQPSLAGLDE